MKTTLLVIVAVAICATVLYTNRNIPPVPKTPDNVTTLQVRAKVSLPK
ncbi:MAG: hypothetical protein NT077_02325 [Candidatus Taylorbacteria bacterium]|nr:hypothetical protein [Candidatus Taylorbacteria bacterium]